MPVAEIRVADRPGVFVADEARVDGVFVHATGRWRRRLGAGEAWSGPRSYSWSAATVVQIRWAESEATA